MDKMELWSKMEADNPLLQMRPHTPGPSSGYFPVPAPAVLPLVFRASFLLKLAGFPAIFHDPTSVSLPLPGPPIPA